MLYLARYLRTASITVRAYPRRLALVTDKRRAAHRATFHKFHRTAAFLTLRFVDTYYLRNNLTAFLHVYIIAVVNVELADYILIMKRSALNHRAGKQYRLKICDRRNHPHPSGLERHEFQLCQCLLCLKLISYGPTRRLRRAPEKTLLLEIIDLEYKPVCRYFQFLPFNVPIINELLHFLHRLHHPHGIRHLEPPALHGHKAFIMCLERKIVAKQIIKICVKTATRDFRRIQGFQCSGRRVPGIGKQRFLIVFTLLIERVERFPRHQNLAAHLKTLRIVTPL